jgi:hypothetical protein
VVDALTGWLGLVLIGAALALTVALEVRDERADRPARSGAVVTARQSRRATRVLHLVLAALVLAVLAATVVRLVALTTGG